MWFDAVQRRIIKHGHQLCRSWPPIGQSNTKLPRFFRARLQMVAERNPRHLQTTVGLPSHDVTLGMMKFPVLIKIEQRLHAVHSFRHVRINEMQDRIGKLTHLFFQYAIPAQQHVIERHAVFRASNHQMRRPAQRNGVTHATEHHFHRICQTGIRQSD